jgi:hypothetical protein
MPRNNVCGNTTCCIRIVHVAIHSYCHNVCLIHIQPNAMPDYVAIKVIATTLVVASIINSNVSLRGNNHDYCNNIKNYCRMLLQRYYFLPLLTKVTMLLLEDIAISMTLLQPYFTVAIDQFSSSWSHSFSLNLGGSEIHH